MKRNIAALLTIQVANLFVPLMMLSLLARRLGVEGFGEYSAAIAFGAYFSVAVEWGFGLTATRRVAIAAQDITLRSRIFYQVIFGRFLILIPLAIIFGISITLVDSKRSPIYLAAFLPAVAGTINSNFLFQGLENMQKVVSGTIFAKILPIPLVYLLVDRPGDELLAVTILGASTSLTFLYGFSVAIRHNFVRKVRVKFADVVCDLCEGFSIFSAGSVMTFFANANVLLLGRTHGFTEVGNFSSANNLIKAICSVYAPVSQAVFPRMVSEFEGQLKKNNSRFLWLLVSQGGFGALLSVLVWWFGPDLLLWYFGSAYGQAVDIVQWLSVLPFLLAISNVLGIQYLVPKGKLKTFSTIMYSSAILGFFAIYLFVPNLAGIGGAFSLILAELAVVILMAVAVTLAIKYPKN